MSSNRKRFICEDCRVDTGRIGEHYMLKDEVWFNVHPSKIGMLCVGCIEKRLDRKLVPSDFTKAYVNNLNFGFRSVRLVSRIIGS